jgi:hypothetical protein
MPETVAGAPAGAGTETVSATRAAADSGDVSAFLEADRSQRGGKLPERVERPKQDPSATAAKVGTPGRPNAMPTAGKDGKPATGPTAADRDADERLTTRIRDAVDTSTKAANDRIADLERRLADATKAPAKAGGEAVPAGDPPKGTPEYKRYLAMPDAPKVEEFDSIAEHSAAVAVFIHQTMNAERTEAARNGARAFDEATQSIERVKTFHGRIQEYKQQDPEFATKLSPDVKALHGWGKLQETNRQRAERGEAPIAATVDHAIAEQMYDSDAPAQVGVFLSEHPEELAALRQCRSPQQLIKAFGRVEDKARAAYTAAAAPGAGAGTPPASTPKQSTPTEVRERAEAVVERSVSRANPPAPTLGKAGSVVDPIKHALDSGDVGMFLELDRQAMAEKRGIRR